MLHFALEISPALNSLQQTLKMMTVQKGTMHANVTTFRDDLRGMTRGPRALSPRPPPGRSCWAAQTSPSLSVR